MKCGAIGITMHFSTPELFPPLRRVPMKFKNRTANSAPVHFQAYNSRLASRIELSEAPKYAAKDNRDAWPCLFADRMRERFAERANS
jgi:hypothetical protein